MEGQGVTNYAVDKPSYAYTTATTEFDDELIRRGVVTTEQAMVAKGASAEEAHRLTVLAKKAKEGGKSTQESNSIPKDDFSDDKSDDDDDFLDDDFLQKYRQQRIAELKKEHSNSTESSKDRGMVYYGEAVPIQRPDWTYHVNEASQDSWVVVTLTSNNLEVTGAVEAAAKALAKLCPSVKFVMIPSQSAIDNWPDSNLPSVFVYRHGEMQRELIGMKRSLTVMQLQKELEDVGVEFSKAEVSKVRQHNSQQDEARKNILKQRILLADEESDDEVQ